MTLNILQGIFKKLLSRKAKGLKKHSFNFSNEVFESVVFYYMLLNFDIYVFGALKQDSENKYYCNRILEEDKELFFDKFLDTYKDSENKYIKQLCLLYSIPENLREVFEFDFPYGKLEFIELFEKIVQGGFYLVLDKLLSEYFSETEVDISICSKYSKRLPTPKNNNLSGWTLRDSIDLYSYVNHFSNKRQENDFNLNFTYSDEKQGKQIKEAILFYNFIKNTLYILYVELFGDCATYENDGKYYKKDFYDKRREFLSFYIKHENPYIQIIAYSYFLPIKAFRSFLWERNVDLQDIESYLRRMKDFQFSALKNAYNLIFSEPSVLASYCSKGWKHIFHIPSLEEVLNEELYDESARFKQNWAVVKNEAFLDMGFTKYRGNIDDTENFNNSYLKKKDHKGYKDNGFSEFYTNPDGFYGISTRKIFGNYLWGDFESQKIGGWVCPRFWTTFVIYLLLFLVSPICDLFLLFESIESDKVFLWISIFGSLFPLLSSMYLLKITWFLFLKLIGKISTKAEEFLKRHEKQIIDFLFNEKSKKSILFFAQALSFFGLVYVFSYAYDFVVAVVFTAILEFYICYCVLKGYYVHLHRIPYGKYIVFFVVSIHLIYGWEFIANMVMILFNFFVDYNAYLIGLLFVILPAFCFVRMAKSYMDIQDKYVKGGNISNIDSLFDNLVIFVVFCFFAFLIGEMIFFTKFMDLTLVDNGLKLISVFIGINLLFLLPNFYFFSRPVVLENERNMYEKSKDVVKGEFYNKSTILATSNNKWLLDRKNDFFKFYCLYDSFISTREGYLERIFVNFINRLDDEFLFEVRCLRTILNFKDIGFADKYIRKLILTDMTAREVVDYFEKRRIVVDKVYKKFEVLFSFIALICSIILYPFKITIYCVNKFCSLIFDFFDSIVDFIHNRCPYSNESNKI